MSSLQVGGQGSKINDVGEQDRCLLVAIGNDSLALLQAYGDLAGQDIEQQRLRPLLFSSELLALSRNRAIQEEDPSRRRRALRC